MPFFQYTSFMWIFSHLEATITKIPSCYGVYIMRSKDEHILYVGKSVNLHARVASYFHPQATLNAAKTQMVKQVAHIEWIETATEMEALILETNLIKTHHPKYNVLMKDDKNLSYLVLPHSPVGSIEKTRIKWERWTYFGPYASWVQMNQTLKTLKRIFKIRSCRMIFEKTSSGLIIASKAGRSIPCMDHYIGLCPAPCLLKKENLEEHEKNMDQLKRFLRGELRSILVDLEEQMKEKAKRLEFEEAQKIKEMITSLSLLSLRQVVRDGISGNVDIIEYLEKYEKLFIAITTIRNGEIIGVIPSEIHVPLQEDITDIFENILSSRYEEGDIPNTICIHSEVISPLLHQFLLKKNIHLIDTTNKESLSVNIREWSIFTLKNLMNFAFTNEMNLLEHRSFSREIMSNILHTFWYNVPKKWPIIFECYDNSHTDGRFTVASRSVMVNGKMNPSLYRRYNLKTLQSGEIDDFKSMREIMERRALEGIEKSNFPTLILIDGWKGQLSSALQGIQSAVRAQNLVPYERVKDIEPLQENENKQLPLPYIISIAKREEEIFIPNHPDSIRFEHGSLELMLLQKLRDEAHRFAIQFNRKKRSKDMKINILEELPGFGPATRKKLLKIASSIEEIQKLSRQELLSVCSERQIETLIDHGLYGGNS